ncbi:unnamed protein product [Schistosoma margrebowiei]|uniref:Uncharacterized protein n=1 Tax=Schistosoma margrebowiei TaxID=48269 RepID=A0A183MB94_9TREM|nr:unnamed protein product [Schistosoma margrebowiei]
MVVGGSQQETLDPGFRATWHSSVRCTCNLEGTGAPWRIRSRVTQLHSQRRHH